MLTLFRLSIGIYCPKTVDKDLTHNVFASSSVHSDGRSPPPFARPAKDRAVRTNLFIVRTEVIFTTNKPVMVASRMQIANDMSSVGEYKSCRLSWNPLRHL